MTSAGIVSQVAGQLEALDQCIAMVRALGRGSGRASGPHGRVLRDAKHVLKAINAKAAFVGGLAVIHHGYELYTRYVDLVLDREAVAEFLRIAPVQGFRVAKKDRYGWHKLIHKQTGMDLHLVPEGRPSKRAPSDIPGPRALGVRSLTLGFPTLHRLVELKLLAGRLKDDADVVELLKRHWSQRAKIREHLSQVHSRFVVRFDRLVAQAESEIADDLHR